MLFGGVFSCIAHSHPHNEHVHRGAEWTAYDRIEQIRDAAAQSLVCRALNGDVY